MFIGNVLGIEKTNRPINNIVMEYRCTGLLIITATLMVEWCGVVSAKVVRVSQSQSEYLKCPPPQLHRLQCSD